MRSRSWLTWLVTALVVVVGGVARADDGQAPGIPAAGFDPTDALSPISIVEGPGFKVGEGTVLHPIVGLETGVVSNVFYQDADTPMTQPVAAGLLRVLAMAGMGSLSPQRLGATGGDPLDPDDTTMQGSGLAGTLPQAIDRGDFQYRLDVFGSYDQYLSSDGAVTDQGGFGGGVLFRGIVNPERPVAFAFMDDYNRLIRPTNFESSSDTNRDINTLNLRLNIHPTGRSLFGYAYLVDVIDVFEAESQRFADRFQNSLGARLNYQVYPWTRLFLDVSEGVFTGLGASSKKVTSYPLVAQVGIQTILTLNLTVNAHIGYTQGFYEQGPDYATIIGGLQMGYRYSPLGRATFLYSYDHADSINANFYRDHMLQATLEQAFLPFSVFLKGELHFREYQGVEEIVPMASGNTRDDTIFAVTAGLRYSFRSWIAATLDYVLTIDSTDFRYDVGGGALDDPSYVRHEVLLGVRAAL